MTRSFRDYVVTGGEIIGGRTIATRRRTRCCSHFWRRSAAFQGSTRPKPITPNAAPVVPSLGRACLPFSFVVILINFALRPPAPGTMRKPSTSGWWTSSTWSPHSAHKPVKITMTGPHVLAKVAYDSNNDLPRMMTDLARLLRHNFLLLAVAGQEHQITNRYLPCPMKRRWTMPSMRSTRDRRHAQGHPRVDALSSGQLRRRQGIRCADRPPLLDTGRYKADKVCKIECALNLDRYDMAQEYSGLPRQPAAGGRRGSGEDTQGGDRGNCGGSHQGLRLVGARTDHRDQFVRLHSSDQADGAGKMLAMTEAADLGGSANHGRRVGKFSCANCWLNCEECTVSQQDHSSAADPGEQSAGNPQPRQEPDAAEACR